MKRIYLTLFGLILVAVAFVFTACKKDGPFAMIKSSNSISINGSVDNLTIPGGIAAVAGLPTGAIAPFDVVVDGTSVTSVNITNRYTIVPTAAIPAPPTVEKLLGTFPVANGKASIPAILISSLRNATDPVINSITANAVNGPGTNNFLIDALLTGGTTERRIIGITLANSVIVLDGDIYKINVPSSPSAGVPAIVLTVNSTVLGVRITSRYVLPGQSTAKSNGAGTIYATTVVDAVTNKVTIPALTPAQLRDPADPQITGLDNVGQQFILIEALNGTLPASTVLSSKTANLTW